MRKRWITREVIPAVHKKDLETILSDLGLIDDIRAGKYNCAVCGNSIKLEDIQCLYKEHGEIRVCCREMDCLSKLLWRKSE